MIDGKAHIAVKMQADKYVKGYHRRRRETVGRSLSEQEAQIKDIHIKVADKRLPILSLSGGKQQKAVIGKGGLEMSKNVKFAIRTGEFTPYPNVILRAGVAFPA